jgi:hypothetical protein
MAKNARAKKNKHRGMHRRILMGKKPMSLEQKEIQKKAREAQKEITRKDVESKRLKKIVK